MTCAKNYEGLKTILPFLGEILEDELQERGYKSKVNEGKSWKSEGIHLDNF